MIEEESFHKPEEQITTDKPSEKGWEPINFDITKLNLDKAMRKHAFYHSVGSELSKADQLAPKSRPDKFDKVGDVLPIELVEHDEESKSSVNWKVLGDIREESNWTPENAAKTLANFRLIKRRKIVYDKPVLVIYNPNSGKKKNFIPMIETRFEAANIPFELKPTTQALDPLNFAMTIDLSNYSLLVACGGDGTVHEVVNGMLAREDKKKIPLAILPNGSGDDFCSSLGILSMDHALDYICKGETIKVDTARVLLDHDSEDSLPQGLERLNFCRHMIINSGCAMPPLIAFKAKYWKTCCGKTSYAIATLVEAMKGNLVSEIFEVHVDGEKFT